jgi:hypothetical protein
MKIKILSRTKGNIVAAVLPPDAGVQNLTEGGPAARTGTMLDEIELPATISSAEIPQLLRHARVKRGKKSVALEVLKKPPTRVRAARKTRR